jgi:membrane-bound inhibitor of C-type lysozyme
MNKLLKAGAAGAGALLLASCSSVNVWPFDGSKSSDRPSAPSNATLYQCNGGKHFYVRYLDNGNTAWIIYPDREVGLAKGSGGAGTRYTNGIAVLEINGSESTLNDGPSIAYTGCKTGAK